MGFQIGTLLIPYYGFFIILGVVAASAIGVLQTHLARKDYNDFILLAAMVTLGAIIGAKILYLIVSLDKIDFSRITEFEYLNSIMSGGFVFYGGLIGGLLALIPCRKLIGPSLSSYVHVCMPCIPLVHAFGRLGCNAVGCCYGMPYSGIFSIVYENSLFAPNHIELFPVQAVEAGCNFLITAILLWYIDINKKHPINSICLYLLLYSPVRFILEFARSDNDERGIYGIFSTSQWISLFLIVGTLIYCFYKHPSKGYENQV